MRGSTSDRPEGHAPVIHGLAVGDALRRLGGKLTLFWRVLGAFVQNHASAGEALRSSLAAGDRATAERTAHTLKGLAATVGATALAEVAAEVERAIRVGWEAEALAPLVGRLGAELTRVVAAMEAAQRTHLAVAAPSPPQAARPAAPLGDVMERLVALAASCDSECGDHLATWRHEIACAMPAEDFASLDAAITRYAFDEALGILERLGFTAT